MTSNNPGLYFYVRFSKYFSITTIQNEHSLALPKNEPSHHLLKESDKRLKCKHRCYKGIRVRYPTSFSLASAADTGYGWRTFMLHCKHLYQESAEYGSRLARLVMRSMLGKYFILKVFFLLFSFNLLFYFSRV